MITWKNVAAFNPADLIKASAEATDAFTESVQGIAKRVDPTKRQAVEGEREGKLELKQSIADIQGLQGLGDIRGAEERFDQDILGADTWMSEEQVEKVGGVYDRRLGRARDEATESALTKANLAAGAEEDVMVGKRTMVEELRAQGMSEPEIEKRVAQFDASGLQEETYAAALKKRTDEAIREWGPLVDTNMEINEMLNDLGTLEGNERINLDRAKTEFESMVKGRTADRKFNQRQNELKVINGQATIEEIAAEDKDFDAAAATVNLRKFQEVQDKLPPEERRKYEAWQKTANIKSEAVAQQHDLGIANQQARYDAVKQHEVNPIYIDQASKKKGGSALEHVKQQTDDGGFLWFKADMKDLRRVVKENIANPNNGIDQKAMDAIVYQAWANNENEQRFSKDKTVTKAFLDDVKRMATNYSSVQTELNTLNSLKADKIKAVQTTALEQVNDSQAYYEALQDNKLDVASAILERASTMPTQTTASATNTEQDVLSQLGFPQTGDTDTGPIDSPAPAPTTKKASVDEMVTVLKEAAKDAGAVGPGGSIIDTRVDTEGLPSMGQINEAANNLLQYDELSQAMASPIIKAAEFLAQIQVNAENQGAIEKLIKQIRSKIKK
jgi:hypothetical protein